MTKEIDDPDRLAALERSGLLRHPEQERFDVLCETAAALLRAPLAQLNVLTGDMQTSIGKYPEEGIREVPVKYTGCQHVVIAEEPVSIPNTLLHPVMCISPVVTIAGVRSYLGVPIFFDGEPVGSFCVADYTVREWSGWDIVGLQGLARLAGLAVDRGD